jgi:hypothetical protein
VERVVVAVVSLSWTRKALRRATEALSSSDKTSRAQYMRGRAQNPGQWTGPVSFILCPSLLEDWGVAQPIERCYSVGQFVRYNLPGMVSQIFTHALDCDRDGEDERFQQRGRSDARLG